MRDHSEDLDLGTPGGSARREHDRRRANRERATRSRHPRIGGVLLALREQPAHERVWEIGAAGEEETARVLAKNCPRAIVLHDRRVPGRRTNIDHVAVSACGVHVIDTKRYKGKKVRVANPLFGSAKLTIGGSDKTKLVDGLAGQVEIVTGLLAHMALDVPVRGAFCFIDADLPLIGVPSIRGLPIFGRRGLVKRVNRDGPLDDVQIRTIATRLAADLKPA